MMHVIFPEAGEISGLFMSLKYFKELNLLL